MTPEQLVAHARKQMADLMHVLPIGDQAQAVLLASIRPKQEGV